MNFIIWLLAGAIIGWLASIVVRRRSAPSLDIFAGMAGAFAAGYLLTPVFRIRSFNQSTFSLPALIIALGGAVFLLAVVRFVRREPNVKNEVIARKWTQVLPKIHTRWDKLTDEDVASIDGSHNRFIAAVQARYGCAYPEAEDQIQRYLRSVLIKSRRSSSSDPAQVVDQLPDRHP